MHNTDKEKVGDFIRERRTERGMTQAELGKKIFRSDKSVSKWEKGASYPDQEILIALANALECTVSDIMRGAIVKEDDAKRLEELELFYTKHCQLEGQIFIDKENPNRWLYQNLIYEFPSSTLKMEDLLYSLDSCNPEMYDCGYHFMFTLFAKNISPCVWRDQREQFESLKDLLLRAVDEYDPTSNSIDGFQHLIIFGLGEQIYRGIFNESVKLIKKIKTPAWSFHFNSEHWMKLLPKEEVDEVTQKFFDKHIEDIKIRVLADKKQNIVSYGDYYIKKGADDKDDDFY